MMRLLILSLSAGIAAMAPAYASSQNCTRGGDVRTIEVVTPGVIGAACDLRYVRENGANISVPYHADYSATFCNEQAAALVTSLVGAGYTCTTTVAPLREVSNETPSQTVIALEPVQETVAEHTAPAEGVTGEFIPETPLAQSAYPDAPIVAEAPIDSPERTVLGQPAAAAPSDFELADAPESAAEPEEISAESRLASRGPTALSTTLASAQGTTTSARSSVVGRLVGAAPDAAPIAKPAVVAASEERLAPVASNFASNAAGANVAPVASAAPEPMTQIASVAAAPRGVRPAADIIKGVLSAQVAAWNEGDLEAFMGGYWKSPDVRFVSGTAVTKGWTQTLKKYRDRYGQSASLGRLSFDALDVQMVTDDVAVVIGRFNLASAAATETGAFTLVMKRFDGLWRIVHDHSVGDPATTQ